MFLDTHVESLLLNNFVEVRLHTDGLAGARKTRNLELQAQLASSIANPWMVVVDPNTETPGEQSGFLEVEELTEFLTKVMD